MFKVLRIYFIHHAIHLIVLRIHFMKKTSIFTTFIGKLEIIWNIFIFLPNRSTKFLQKNVDDKDFFILNDLSADLSYLQIKKMVIP